MSVSQPARHFGSLLSGRWQVPVALAAAAAAAAALYRLTPAPVTVPPDTVLAEIAALEQSGAVTEAADAIANLLASSPPLSNALQAALHDRMAELVYRAEVRRGKPEPSNARLVLEHHDAARRLGCPATPERLMRSARAAEWAGDRMQALETYRELARQEDAGRQRHDALQALVRLTEGRPGAEAERSQTLEALLADEAAPAEHHWWAIQRCLQDAFDANDPVQARLLLGKYGTRLKSSELRGYWEYLWAWVMLQEGRPDEARPLVEWIEDWLESRPEDDELDTAGRLAALNRWLLGQIHLAENQPEEALASFEEALALQPDGDLVVAATAGRVTALANLGRHALAQEVLRGALEKLPAGPATPDRVAQRLKQVGLHVADELCRRDEPEAAVPYLELAVRLAPAEAGAERLELLSRLGETCRAAAERATTPARVSQYRGQAGHYLAQAAELARDDDARYAALWWTAAQELEAANRSADAQRAWQRFLEGRSNDPRLPRAMLQLARTFELAGQLEPALDACERIRRQYPLLEEAFRAAVLSASCLDALGRPDEAESILDRVLADDNITPQASAYREALLALGELLFSHGRYGAAIGRLEDFGELYPEDPESHRVRYLLADSYRRSGEALLSGEPSAAAREEGRQRLQAAAPLYGALADDLEHAETEESAAYRRLAVLYQGDCLLALNDPQSLRAALEVFAQAAVRYEREPASLTARVQMATIHLRLGEPAEAARMLARARWLARSIPDAAFAAAPGGADRASWERYLTAISSSDPFRGALNGAR